MMFYAEHLKDVRDETSGAAEMQQWHKGTKPETATSNGKQGKCQRGPEADQRAEGIQASSRVFCCQSKNECQDTVEVPANAQAKEDTSHSLNASNVGVPATRGYFALSCTKRRNGGTP